MDSDFKNVSEEKHEMSNYISTEVNLLFWRCNVIYLRLHKWWSTSYFTEQWRKMALRCFNWVNYTCVIIWKFLHSTFFMGNKSVHQNSKALIKEFEDKPYYQCRSLILQKFAYFLCQSHTEWPWSFSFDPCTCQQMYQMSSSCNLTF